MPTPEVQAAVGSIFTNDVESQRIELNIGIEVVIAQMAIFISRNELRRNPSFFSRELLPTSHFACIQTALLLDTYPQLALLPQFPSLSRYLGMLERISGNEIQPGKSLLIGSGNTAPEIAALYTFRPDYDQTNKFTYIPFENIFTKKISEAKDDIISGTTPQIPLKDGSVVFIEPEIKDTYRFLNSLEGKSGYWKDKVEAGYPNKLVDLPNMNLGTLDTILAHRADPAAFYEFGNLNRDVLKKLIESLNPGGRIIVTVGSGNNNKDFQKRQKLLRDLSQFFRRSLHDLSNNVIPEIFLADYNKALSNLNPSQINNILKVPQTPDNLYCITGHAGFGVLGGIAFEKAA